MTIQSLAQDLENSYEGKGFCQIEASKWTTELSIDGDEKNMLYITYEYGKEVGREIKPKRELYQWEKNKLAQGLPI